MFRSEERVTAPNGATADADTVERAKLYLNE
jgi:hypothetical protein